MNRRHFLRAAVTASIGAAAAAVVDPELLAWVPGQKKTFDLKPFISTSSPVTSIEIAGQEVILRAKPGTVFTLPPPSPMRLDVLMGWTILRPSLGYTIHNVGVDPVQIQGPLYPLDARTTAVGESVRIYSNRGVWYVDQEPS